MEIKIHKELRAKPKVFGLEFGSFLTTVAGSGIIAIILIATTVSFSKFILWCILTVVIYAVCLKISNNSHRNKVENSADINFYTDNLNAW